MINVYNHSNHVCVFFLSIHYTLIFNIYMQYYIVFLLISLEDYTSSYIFSGYIVKLHYILILDTINWVMPLVIKPLVNRFRR